MNLQIEKRRQGRRSPKKSPRWVKSPAIYLWWCISLKALHSQSSTSLAFVFGYRGLFIKDEKLNLLTSRRDERSEYQLQRLDLVSKQYTCILSQVMLTAVNVLMCLQSKTRSLFEYLPCQPGGAVEECEGCECSWLHRALQSLGPVPSIVAINQTLHWIVKPFTHVCKC